MVLENYAKIMPIIYLFCGRGVVTIDFKALLDQYATPTNLVAANIGLEREGQRVMSTGQLASTAFPAVFNYPGSPIQRDFAETQLELVTPITTSAAAAIGALQKLQTTVQRTLSPTELIWPLSMPPALPVATNQIPIARLADPLAVRYRQQLAKVYGRRRQMLSGVHLNIELAPQLLVELFQHQTEFAVWQDFKNAAYFKIARNYLHYRWLITYLFGATPVSEAHFFTTPDRPQEPVRSLRNSRYGYTNATQVQVSYGSLTRYLADLQTAVATGQLSAVKEFYGHIRLRGGHQMTDLAKTGVQYLELRHLDLNPLAPVGITVEQVKFVQLFLILMLTLPETAAADQWVASGTVRNQATALTPPWSAPLRLAEGTDLLAMLAQLVDRLQLTSFQSSVQHAQSQLRHHEQTLAAQWWQLIQPAGQTAAALQAARHYQAQQLAI